MENESFAVDPILVQELRMIGLGEALATRVAEEWGATASRRINENPYSLMRIEGISFTKADGIARTYFGISENDSRRHQALIEKFLDDNTAFGHTFYPISGLQDKISKFNVGKWEENVAKMIMENVLVLDGERLYLKKLFDAEMALSVYIRDRIEGSHYYGDDSSYGLEDLDTEQRRAVTTFDGKKVMIITGGPGTGKTFVINEICRSIKLKGARFALCAPTGKAAKRVQELTGEEAKTIHRLLGAGFGTWKYNASRPLMLYDWVIVDESSMMDIELAWRLLQALPSKTHIIFVGDRDQLPPVGPGTFFKDIILTDRIYTVKLQTNHRQGKGNLIAENALRINRGETKLVFDDDDLVFMKADNPIIVREKLPHVVAALAKTYDPIEEIQVLAPQKMGNIGVEELNKMLRFLINPGAKAHELFSVGDKVMQTVNDYELDVFNGFVGKVMSIGRDHYNIHFFDKGPVKYPNRKLENLMLAYCCTVHKYQGSECKSGVFILSSSHTYMLTRNLLYTAMTRFKEICVFLGDVMALARACKNTKTDLRYSMLKERIRGEVVGSTGQN